LATVRPADGGEQKTFAFTPRQFEQYINGPDSLFDATAEKGVVKTFSRFERLTVGQSPKAPASAPVTPPGYDPNNPTTWSWSQYRSPPGTARTPPNIPPLAPLACKRFPNLC
jgi:hypothetical protein